MILLELAAPFLWLYTTVVVGVFQFASSVTGIPGYEIMDGLATTAGLPNPESAGVADLLTGVLSN